MTRGGEKGLGRGQKFYEDVLGEENNCIREKREQKEDITKREK